MTHRFKVNLTIAGLVGFTLSVAAYKVQALGYDLSAILPDTRYRVSYDLSLDGHGDDVQVRTFLPSSDAHQRIVEEQNQSGDMHLTTSVSGLNRIATWSGTNVPDGTHIQYQLSVYAKALRFDLDPSLTVPLSYPPDIQAYLRPEKDIQVDHPEIEATLRAIGAQEGTIVERLRRIYDFTSGLTQLPFKGTTDALTALRLREASCNGKSRLFVALARATGIPARLVGGIIMSGGSKKTSHQWTEAYVAGHWVPFCPTNHHFAELPERYLVLYHGDETLFRHTADINFDYRFTTTTSLVPSARAKQAFKAFNIWTMFEQIGLPFSLLRTVLMLPLGALVVVLFRNVIGIPTFGTFLPALIAAASGETGLLWGLTGLVLTVLLVAGVRRVVHGLELLHSPTLAILLAAVVLVMLGISLGAYRLGMGNLAKMSVFPIAVTAITAERFFLTLTEQGARPALKELGGTVVVIVACNVVMNSLALQILLAGFPEVLLLAVAADIYLGRWVGVRLFEYLRFRRILFGEARS